MPLALVHLSVYNQSGYTYLIRMLYEQSTFEAAYSSRILEFIKSFGSLYNIGGFLFILGLYILWKKWNLLKNSMNPNFHIFVGILVISLLPVLFWPGITQRVLGITVPFLAIVSGVVFQYYRRYVFWWAPSVILIYAVVNSSMNYLLEAFDISSLINYF